MKLLDTKTTVDLTKLVIFMVVTTIFTGLLVIVIGNLSFSSSREFRAVFADATGVAKGDDIRIAGVKVGTVQGVDLQGRDQAVITFSVDSSSQLTEATRADIRYRNLVGQRYISLSQQQGATTPLAAGATIPLTRTSPALDLTVLFNGFKPLFRALSPADLNQLSFEIVQVFQGEGGSLESLLGHTASVTSTLADRDQVIGQLIENLNTVLVNVGDRETQLSALIVNFRNLVGGLAKDRAPLLNSLNSISTLANQTADLASGIRPPLVEDIKELRELTGTLDRNKGEVDRALQVLPIKLEKIGRTATYGSWFNFYLCDFTGRVIVAGQTVPVEYNTGSDRCNLG